jgi:hypothetical protein
MIDKSHGAFAFSFKTDYTLISVSESWNAECADIYVKFLKKSIESEIKLRRCVIIDGRTWGFETPEGSQKIQELSKHLAEHYKSIYIAYYLSSTNIHLGQIIINENNQKFKETIFWNCFQTLEESIHWLTSKGFTIPPLTDDDFPKPVHASYYLKYLDS